MRAPGQFTGIGRLGFMERVVVVKRLNDRDEAWRYWLARPMAERVAMVEELRQERGWLLGHESTAFTLARYSHWVDSDPPLLTRQVMDALGA